MKQKNLFSKRISGYLKKIEWTHLFLLGIITINLGKLSKKIIYLIKYEDLVKNTKEEVLNLSIFKKFFKINVKKNIDQIIENSSFSNLQKIENEGKFNENTKNQITGEKNKFFNSGHQMIGKNAL